MNVVLWLPVKNKHHRALSIPFNEFQRFSSFPLAWLSYVAYTIYGRQGHISTLAGGPKLDCHTETIQPSTEYYYVPQVSDPCFLDPDLMEDRASTTTTGTTTTGRGDFKRRLLHRDGSTCVLTGSGAGFEACHIIPHSKGDEYVINFVKNRPEDIVDPPLDDINDTRNGILLHSAFHRAFGNSEVAFLRTPNTVMGISDVELVKQPNFDRIHGPQYEPYEKRLTFQHFNDHDSVIITIAPHNCDARLPDNDWPSDIILDAAYGIAVLKKWGIPAFLTFIRKYTKDIYYNNRDSGGDENNGGGGANGGDKGEGTSGGKSKRAERAERRSKAKSAGWQGGHTKQSPDFYDMLLGLHQMTNNAGKVQHKVHAGKGEESWDKVLKWRETTG